MRYAKFVVAALIAGGVALQAALTDDHVTNTEWLTIGIAVLGALGVWAIPNKTEVKQPADGTVRRSYID